MLPDTLPKLDQVTPSVEYWNVPFPVTEVMAIPLSAAESASLRTAVIRMSLTRVGDEVVFSSVPTMPMPPV